MNQYNIKQLINQASSIRQDFKIFFDEKENHYLPLTIINGKEKGNVLTLIAGIHGCEYPPIIAIQEILKEVNPQLLKGTLIIIPIANVSSFYHRTPFVHPSDQKNLNNIFPGSPSGSISEQIAHWITQNIIQNSDILIDLHGGDANEDLVPFACFYQNNNDLEKTQKAKQLAQVSGFPYVVSYPYNISPNEPALYTFKQAVQNRIISLSLEAGKLGNLQKDAVELLKIAIKKSFHFLKIYPFSFTEKQISQKFLSQQTYIKAPKKGLFYSNHQSGNEIKKGESLGFITDDFGNKICKVIAPTHGIILYKIGTPPVNQGETLFCIGIE